MIRILTVAALVAMALPLGAVAESAEGRGVTLAGTAPAPEEGPPGAAHIPGMNPAALAGLKLSGDQRNKVTEIERDLKRKQLKLFGAIRELRWKQQDAFRAPEVDVEAVRRTYEEVSALRKEMFDLAIDARKRVESVLTKEQRIEVSEWTSPSQPGHRVIEPGPEKLDREGRKDLHSASAATLGGTICERKCNGPKPGRREGAALGYCSRRIKFRQIFAVGHGANDALTNRGARHTMLSDPWLRRCNLIPVEGWLHDAIALGLCRTPVVFRWAGNSPAGQGFL